jgi:hypothetical protein
MTRALSGENVQRALDRGRARGADGAEISAAELLRHTDQFAHRVLHVDLADADPARRARAWNESFVAQNSFPASCFERLAEIDRRYAPPPNPSIVVWTIGRPQALVHMDLVPMNIIYDIRRSAGKENVDVEHAIIDPDRAVMAPRAMATAFYVARTRDPLLWTSNSMWLDPLTRGIEPVDMVAAMSYFLTLEGSRKSVGPVSLVQSFGTDVYSARRRQHLRELEELPDGPYKRAAMETIRDREMTESRRDQFEDEAEAAFAVTRKYWDHAQELTETWRDLCRSPGEHLAGRGLQGRFP